MGYTMEQDHVPATMAEARKRWQTHTHHVITREMDLALKRDGTSWNEDARGPFIQVEDVKLRFWRRRTGNTTYVYCGIALQ